MDDRDAWSRFVGLLGEVVPVACPALRCLRLTNFVPSGHRSPHGGSRTPWLPRCERLTLGLCDGVLDLDDLRLLQAVRSSACEVSWNLEDVVSFPEVIVRFVSLLGGLVACRTMELEWQKGYLTDRPALLPGPDVVDDDVRCMARPCVMDTGPVRPRGVVAHHPSVTVPPPR